MYPKKLFPILLLVLASITVLMAQTARRPFKLDDLARLRDQLGVQLLGVVVHVVTPGGSPKPTGQAHGAGLPHLGRGD